MTFDKEIAKEQFMNAKPGDTVMYIGRHIVKEANGSVLVLAPFDDPENEFNVNLSMFLQKQGRVLESETANYKVPDSPIMPQPGDTGFAMVKKNFKKYTWQGKFVKTFEGFNKK